MRCNTRFAGVLLALSVLMSGCGEEGGFPPVLTGFDRDNNDPYVVGHKGGAIGLPGKVYFEDPDGDVVLLSVTWQDCGREPAKRLEIVQEDLKRTKIGEMRFTAMVSTNCPIGVYTVNLFVTDGRGYTSNVMAVPYEIYAPLQ